MWYLGLLLRFFKEEHIFCYTWFLRNLNRYGSLKILVKIFRFLWNYQQKDKKYNLPNTNKHNLSNRINITYLIQINIITNEHYFIFLICICKSNRLFVRTPLITVLFSFLSASLFALNEVPLLMVCWATSFRDGRVCRLGGTLTGMALTVSVVLTLESLSLALVSIATGLLSALGRELNGLTSSFSLNPNLVYPSGSMDFFGVSVFLDCGCSQGCSGWVSEINNRISWKTDLWKSEVKASGAAGKANNRIYYCATSFFGQFWPCWASCL